MSLSREGFHEDTKRPAETPPRDRRVPVLPLGRTARGPRGRSRPAHRGGDARRPAVRGREFCGDERAGIPRIREHATAAPSEVGACHVRTPASPTTAIPPTPTLT